MKKSDYIEKYDKTHRILMYDTDGDGRVVPRMVNPEIAGDMIDEFYEQREKIWAEFKKKVIKGSVSPIRLFMEYNHMTLKETAAMVGISASRLKKHLTMEGFESINVKTLKKYARVFNIPLCSLFQLLEYRGEVKIDVKNHQDGVIQEIKISD